MIVRREGRWVRYYEDDGETLKLAVELPEGPITHADVERFRDHLLKVIKEQEAGPS